MALQITGATREIVRKIAPGTLRDSLNDIVGNHIPSIMVLAQTLANRYGPLQFESSSRALSEYLRLARLPNEPTDAFL